MTADKATVVAQRRVAGVLTVASPLPLQQDALNVRVSLRIGRHIVGVTTPAVDAENPKQLCTPAVRVRTRPQVGPSLTLSFGPPRGWGPVRSTKMCFAWQLHIDVLCPVTLRPDDISALIRAPLTTWAERLVDWLFVRAPTSLAVGPRAVRRSRLALDGATDETAFTLVVPAREPEGADISDFHDASRRSALMGGPPLSHVLLVHAEQKRWEDDRRGAVIDAGNATEVALAQRIARTLTKQGLHESLVEPIVQQANGIAGLVRLDGALGGLLPLKQSQIWDQLAGPRNRAAHAGDTASEGATLAAVRVARLVVEAADPLPQVQGNPPRVVAWRS
jgi:hypothetical protein